MKELSFKSSNHRHVIENIKGAWVVFEIKTFLGKDFKTKIGEAKTKKDAEKLLPQ